MPRVQRYFVCIVSLTVGLQVGPSAVQAATAITNATVLTMGQDDLIEDAVIVFDEGKITGIGQGIDVPEGAEIIDAEGMLVTPGLMNSYTQLGLSQGSAPSAGVGDHDYSAGESDYGPAFDILYGLNPSALIIPVVRLHGITRAVSAPITGSSLFAGYGNVIDLSGTPEMIRSRRVAMFAEFGTRGAEMAGGARDAAVLEIDEAFEDAIHFDNNRNAYDRGQSREYSLGRKDLEALVPVVKGKVRLDIHANRASDMRYLIELKKKYGLDLIVRDGQEAWLVAEELAAAGIPVVLNPSINLAMEFSGFNATLANAARLNAAGVEIAFSNVSNPNPSNPEIIRQAAGLAVAHGLPWVEAMKALTIGAARIWGIDESYGSLEVGKDADIVIWDGDPLESMSYPVAVYIRGERMPEDSRQLKLRDRYLQLPAAGDLPPAYF
jgi:imidazolonepropionase-like amidohydrolase